MTLLVYYILQVNVEISTIEDSILAGNYQPNANEEEGPFVGSKKLSEVWPMRPPSDYLSIFVRLPTSQ